jgi:hypothetical protein
LALGLGIFAGFTLVYIRGPILCRSDRELLVRLFPGREMRLLRVLGFFNPPAGLSAGRGPGASM